MIGLFAATNLFLFYVFWELMVVPMFLLIGVWGGTGRVHAALKFLIFTLAGSLLMLVGLISLLHTSGTLDFEALARTDLEPDTAGVALRRVFGGLRGEGADVPRAHVAAGCAHRSTDRGECDPGRDSAEDGRLRVAADCVADPV